MTFFDLQIFQSNRLEIYPVRKLPAFILGMVEIESISSLFLPTGRQGGRYQSPVFSNGVYLKLKKVLLRIAQDL